MNTQFIQFCEELTNQIQQTYTEGVTIPEAEKLAAKFLHAQLMVNAQLIKCDMDARMKKAGIKALKAAVYMEGATKGDKKPSDALLNAQVDMNELVMKEQNVFDLAEVERDALYNYLNIFKEAHVFFRTVSRGQL